MVDGGAGSGGRVSFLLLLCFRYVVVMVVVAKHQVLIKPNSLYSISYVYSSRLFGYFYFLHAETST